MSYRTQPVRLIGGRLCLDFLNTADWSSSGHVVHEKFEDRQDVEIWCRAANLGKRAALEDQVALEDVLAFRASLRRLFLAAVAGEKPKRKDLAHFNQVLETEASTAPLAMREGAFAFNKTVPVTQIIALSALAVLTQATEIERVQICPADDCGWLFLDESKNRRRRWCSMETCGNRAKARRHYQRQTAEAVE